MKNKDKKRLPLCQTFTLLFTTEFPKQCIDIQETGGPFTAPKRRKDNQVQSLEFD